MDESHTCVHAPLLEYSHTCVHAPLLDDSHTCVHAPLEDCNMQRRQAPSIVAVHKARVGRIILITASDVGHGHLTALGRGGAGGWGQVMLATVI